MRTSTTITELPRLVNVKILETYKGYEIKYHTKKFALAGYQDFYDIYKDGQQIKTFTFFLGESTEEALCEIRNWVTSYDYVESLARRA